ncbi:SDR family NAD(P)-dependent oxidoreductase [Ectopseudomonas mendocina]|jgi:NAD(P)-dependent dehydrogenase (short-subunit alcohol dehydrogenase family)|uniref:Short-chain dehydrogenase n=1 Tax=Ectopseudomonas mendocina TaxID=300 RepID=A0A2R3QUE7_ECTME|nr:SDR family NAD(P)-dependent oxidoreductase [Pseudomonas mendocina]AVO55421.1 short-chain dehydrogenase [Pseudomonas mendocina]
MRVTLITGAASGLGWQLARACHARGDALLLTDIDADGLAARLAELGETRIHGVAGDITDADLHRRLVEACKTRFGRLDLLINNAGITHRSPTVTTAPAVFRKVMAVDYHAPLELTLAALPLLRASRGQVVAIGSMAGWMPLLGRAGYCAAKSALGQAFEVLRAEISRDGIGLLMVYPSFLDTSIDRNALGGDGQPAGHARSTIGKIRGADWMARLILDALDRRHERLFPDRGSWLASLLWRLAPGLYYRKMSQRFAGEMS